MRGAKVAIWLAPSQFQTCVGDLVWIVQMFEKQDGPFLATGDAEPGRN
jgi:hypothetical protein